MIRMIHAAGLTPADKFQVINMANFDDEASKEATTGLIENEGEKVGDLVSVLKDEALQDDEALEEIAEATDVDVNILKDAAETKIEADDEGDKEELSDEEKQAYFSMLWRERMFDSMGRVIRAYELSDASGFLALFSEETIEGEEPNEDKDTVEAIKIVKYVDEDAIAKEGADEVADIIAEATDGDKEAIKEVIEEKEKAVADTAEAVAAYFSDLMGEMAAVAGVEQDAAVAQVYEALERAGEEEAKAIEEGENMIKINHIHGQRPSETALTNNDPMRAMRFPEELGNRINTQVQQSYQIANSPDSIQVPNIQPGQNFNNIGFNYQQTGFNPDINYRQGAMMKLPGAPETMLGTLQNMQFANGDNSALEAVAAMISTAAMVLR